MVVCDDRFYRFHCIESVIKGGIHRFHLYYDPNSKLLELMQIQDSFSLDKIIIINLIYSSSQTEFFIYDRFFSSKFYLRIPKLLEPDLFELKKQAEKYLMLRAFS